MFALALTTGTASADRLITIPLGRKVTYRTMRLDSFAEIAHGRTIDYYLGLGVTPDIEFAIKGEKLPGGSLRSTFDISYNYIAPIVNQAPGISVGVQDVLNQTRDHVRVYAAITWRIGLDTGNVPLETTLGVAQGRRLTPFVGVQLPFSDTFRLLAEHNGYRVAAGIEVRAFRNKFGARLLFRDEDTMLGANLTLRF